MSERVLQNDLVAVDFYAHRGMFGGYERRIVLRINLRTGTITEVNDVKYKRRWSLDLVRTAHQYGVMRDVDIRAAWELIIEERVDTPQLLSQELQASYDDILANHTAIAIAGMPRVLEPEGQLVIATGTKVALQVTNDPRSTQAERWTALAGLTPRSIVT